MLTPEQQAVVDAFSAVEGSLEHLRTTVFSAMGIPLEEPEPEPGPGFMVQPDPGLQPGTVQVVVSGFHQYEDYYIRAVMGPSMAEVFSNPFAQWGTQITSGMGSFMLMQNGVEPPTPAQVSPGFPALAVGLFTTPSDPNEEPTVGHVQTIEMPADGSGVLVTIPLEALHPVE